MLFAPNTSSSVVDRLGLTEDSRNLLRYESPSQYLDPNIAGKYAAQKLIAFTVIGALLWDLLTTLPEEISLVRKRLTLPKFVHYASRMCVLLYATIVTLYNTTPLGHCSTIHILMGVSFVLTLGTTSLLLYIRVCAILEHSTLSIIFFGFLWLSIVMTTLVCPFTSEVTYIGPTKYCRFTFDLAYGFPTWPIVITTVFDTLVLLAISWKLVRDIGIFFPVRGENDSSIWRSMKMLVTSEGLPLFSQSLLRGDKKYYLGTIGVDLLVLLIAFTGFTKPINGSAEIIMSLIFVDTVLKNMLACRLFRQTLLNSARNGQQDLTLPTQRQTSVRFQLDVFLADELLKNRDIRSGTIVIEDVLPPPSALCTRER
ncbi:hypothetical protein NLI96_g6301 [Meripilus lineatus]|uniref:Uncharacterized protein n=1 Tax=Meripilus lineatus TaxID=2056292 RepID=A0AAD5YI71_9APHY|nr:hypothetical protein NLI96_g6301 [Physisporinus lineatus]